MSEQPTIPVPDAAAVVPDAGDPTTYPVVPVAAPPGGKVVTLPSGFNVAIRNVDAIRRRERAFIYEGLDLQDDSNKIALGFAMTDRIVALIIDSWDVRSVDDQGVPFGPVLPVPRESMASLDNMPIGDSAILDDEAEAARKILMPDFSPNPSPASPTAPSAG